MRFVVTSKRRSLEVTMLNAELMHIMQEHEKTTAPVRAGDFTGARMEFGRSKHVEQIYGIKRGTLYNAEKLGLVRGVLLRLKGRKSGVKLWDMESVAQWIRSAMEVGK